MAYSLVSVRTYGPGNRGAGGKIRHINEEVVIVGFTDLDGCRPYLGALMLGYPSTKGKRHPPLARMFTSMSSQRSRPASECGRLAEIASAATAGRYSTGLDDRHSVCAYK